MPGTLSINQQETFAAPPIVMSVGPKLEFGSDTQQVTQGRRARWKVVQAAVQLQPQNGMRPVGRGHRGHHHGRGPVQLTVAPGTPVEFNLLHGSAYPLRAA